MNISILYLNEFFWNVWTIVEPLLARNERHGISMATDGALGMSWPSLNCTGVLVGVRLFLQQYQKIHNSELYEENLSPKK